MEINTESLLHHSSLIINHSYISLPCPMDLENPFSYQIDSAQAPLHVLVLEGKLLSAYDAQRFLRTVQEQLGEEKPLYLYLDLKGLEYINSEGLNVLLKLLTMSRNSGGEAWIGGSNDSLNELFILTKIHHIFATVSGPEEAFQEIQAPNSKRKEDA